MHRRLVSSQCGDGCANPLGEQDHGSTVVAHTASFCTASDDLKPVPIYTPEPIPAEWLAITFTPATPYCVVESYMVFFFDSDGRELEFLQFDTLEIAFDQVHAIVGVRQDEWHQCSKAIPDEWEAFDLSVFA